MDSHRNYHFKFLIVPDNYCRGIAEIISTCRYSLCKSPPLFVVQPCFFKHLLNINTWISQTLKNVQKLYSDLKSLCRFSYSNNSDILIKCWFSVVNFHYEEFLIFFFCTNTIIGSKETYHSPWITDIKKNQQVKALYIYILIFL